jgi:replicative DNA helicase
MATRKSMASLARYFTPLFQRQLLALLLQNPETYGHFSGIWSHTYFDETHHRQIAHAYIKIRLAGGEHPTEASLFQELFKEVDPRAPVPLDLQALRREAEAIYTIPTANIDYSLKEVRLWAQNQALIQAINESVDLLQGGKVSEIRPTIDKALSVGADMTNAGITMNAETRNPSTMLLQSIGCGLPTGMATLDLYLKGGLQGGEMLTVVGGPGVFKSGTMLNFSMPAFGKEYGKKVTYISLEMPDVQVYSRYCFRLVGLDYDYLKEHPADFDLRFNEEMKNYYGALHIKAFGSCSLNMAQLRTYLDHLETKGHTTELLILDYPQIMAKADFGGENKEHISVGLLYAGARAIATDRHIPVIVAAQANRDALKNPEGLSLQHISATMDVARHSDFVLAIIQTEEEKKNNQIRLKLLKNRNEEAGIVIKATVDYKKYKLTDIGEWQPPEEEAEDNNSSTSHGNAKATKSRHSRAKSSPPVNGGPPSPPSPPPGTIVRAGSPQSRELLSKLRGNGQK